MHVWIDIDDEKYVPLLSALISELKLKGHEVTITALNKKEIQKGIHDCDINAKVVGKIFSFLGLFKDDSNMLRAALLLDYIKDKHIHIAFSFGSTPLLYSCADKDLPIVLFLPDVEKRPHYIHFALGKCFFLTPDYVTDKKLEEMKIDPIKVRKYKVSNGIENLSSDINVIKEIVEKIEYFDRVLRHKLIA